MSLEIILAGGSGFLGNYLGKQLSENGYRIKLVTRNIAAAKKKLSFPCQLINWENTNGLSLAENINGSYAIINLAGASIFEKAWTKSYRDRIVTSRINSTEKLVRAANQVLLKPKVFIQASAVGFYGNRGDDVLDETSSLGNGFLSQVCLEWESRSLALSKQTRTCIFRLGMILGTNGGALAKLMPIYRHHLGIILGDGLQWLSWVHVKDVTRIVMTALKDDRYVGKFNITSPKPVKFESFHKALGDKFGKQVDIKMPRSLIKFAMGERASLVLDSIRALPTAAQTLGFSFLYPSIEQALDDLIKERPSF